MSLIMLCHTVLGGWMGRRVGGQCTDGWVIGFCEPARPQLRLELRLGLSLAIKHCNYRLMELVVTDQPTDGPTSLTIELLSQLKKRGVSKKVEKFQHFSLF